MTKNSLDVLYTPLDTPFVPKTDINKLMTWINKYFEKQDVSDREDASKVSLVADTYPWNLIYPRVKGSWQYDFQTEFPELSNFFFSAYGLEEKDIKSIVLLPIKPNFKGVGFWHSDPDFHGLRMYIENDEVDDFLLINQTIIPYANRPMFGLDKDFKNTPLKNKIVSAKLYSGNQTFYINNTRAVHAVNVKVPGTLRIAVIVSCVNTSSVNNHVNDLIIRSAEKYKDYSLYFTHDT